MIYVNAIVGIAMYQSVVTPKYNPILNPINNINSILQSGTNKSLTYFLMCVYFLLSSDSFKLLLITF